MKLMADVIDHTIDHNLWDGQSHIIYFMDGHSDALLQTKYDYSCYAINMACRHNKLAAGKIMDFLQSMGADPVNQRQFDFAPSGPERQYARAFWLTWAAMIAREEGLVL